MAAPSDPTFLDQNWDDALRQGFYTTSQGSQLMSYDWFRALERADSRKGFYADGLARHGYLANRRGKSNPDGLPVGFVLDKDRTGYWVGLSCAACHTSQVQYKGITLQIDGGPAQADFHALLVDIEQALRATVTDRGGSKFERFARRVLGAGYGGSEANALQARVKHFLDREWSPFVKVSTTEVPWGRARLDAFGEIFNRVSAIDIDLPGNNMPPDAPVSYPFLWGSSYQNVVQWNGSAPNGNFLARLGRNVGEVLGVFGKVKLRGRSLIRPVVLNYASSVRRAALLGLEGRLRELTAPRWPSDVLGAVAAVKAGKGKVLFAKQCAGCHAIVAQHEEVKVTMTPIRGLGTDPRMATNACEREVLAGRLSGVRMPPIIGRPLPIPPAKVQTVALLGHVVIGAILAPPARADIKTLKALSKKSWFSKDAAAAARTMGLDGAKTLEGDLSGTLKKLHIKLREALGRDHGKSAGAVPAALPDCGPRSPLMAYKGRPLDGVWATAPYLHNGSVANLYEILLPPEQRMKIFQVGSTRFDPVKVGYETEQAPGTTEFDTSLPGNSRLGHDYHNSRLTEDQRWQLVEYMKTL